MSELDDLKKENGELKTKNIELEFTSKLTRFLADQRAETIHKLLESHTELLKRTLHSDENKIILKMVERIKLDNEKYDELQKYLLKSFPKALKVKKKDETEQPKTDRDDLSQSYIDENGNMYAPQHIIDITIILMSALKKQIEDILGDDYSSEKDGSNLL